MTYKQEREKHLRVGGRLYKRYGRPVEKEHSGPYVAITADGRTMLGDTPLDVMQKALEAFGRGSYLFKVGDMAVWTLR